MLKKNRPREIGLLFCLFSGLFYFLLLRRTAPVFARLEGLLFALPMEAMGLLWGIQLFLLGLSLFLLLKASFSEKGSVLVLFCLTLLVLLLWAWFFFRLKLWLSAFFWLALHFALLLLLLRSLYPTEPAAALSLGFYLLWILYWGYLNLGMAVL